MTEIKWKRDEYYDLCCEYAKVGNIFLECTSRNINKRKGMWQVVVSTSGDTRTGPKRRSLEKAKADAVRLAHELLLDYQTCLKAEMANFGLVE